MSVGIMGRLVVGASVSVGGNGVTDGAEFKANGAPHLTRKIKINE